MLSPALTAALPLFAFVAALAALCLLQWEPLRQRLLDHPNERSLHHSPVPRTGGLGVCAGVLPALALLPGLRAAAVAAAALALLSVVDDWRRLSPALRLPVHLLACAAFCALLPLPVWAVAALAVAAAWMTNLYNFMDGADGLAGGMAVIGFGFLGTASLAGGDAALGAAAIAVAAAAVAFLLFNFPPARLFLGDAGSIPLGFLAAALGVLGWQRALWPAWFPVLVFAPFIVDATATLLRRALRGERVWQAHREHCYQRLALMGWRGRRLLLLEYPLMLACGGLGLVLMRLPAALQWAGLAVAGATLGCLMAVVDRCWRQHVAA